MGGRFAALPDVLAGFALACDYPVLATFVAGYTVLPPAEGPCTAVYLMDLLLLLQQY